MTMNKSLDMTWGFGTEAVPRVKRLLMRGLLRGLCLSILLSIALLGHAGEVYEKASDFTLMNHAGQQESLSDHRGAVVMLNFWASWCAPCRQEMPLLESLYQKYRMMGFTVIGVNVEEETKEARALLANMPVSFPVLYDTKNTVSELMKVAAMPTTIMIDREGNKRFLHRGYKPGYEEDYEKQIRLLIRE
jgi:thiol-disulfide isomerase/thioredoxin